MGLTRPRSPFYITPTWDGPADVWDVCQIDPLCDEDEVIFSGTLTECRAEFPGAPVREMP